MAIVTVPQVVLSQAALDEIEDLTAANSHSEAYLTAARALGLPDLASRFTQIANAQAAAGELLPALYAERRSAYEELMEKAKVMLCQRQYEELYCRF